MKVLFDCTSVRAAEGTLRARISGIGYYTYSLMKALQKGNFPDLELNFCRQPSMKQWLKHQQDLPDVLKQFPSIQFLPFPVTVSDFLGKSAGYFTNNIGHFDIIHGTDHYVYPFKEGKKVMNIHDLTFLKYPQFCTNIVKQYTRRIKKCLPWTDLIITFAESTKKDIIDYLGVKKEKIFITSEASRYDFNYLKTINIDLIKSKTNYDFSQKYLLFVSTIEPRKNIISLIKAFNICKEKYHLHHHLILIGNKGWQYEPIFAEIENSPFSDQIHHLGYLTDAQLAIFYAHADMFIYPSFYEGFGLPILEAMTLGTPVITSSVSSMPEVGGDAAIYVNPHDVDALANRIYQLGLDPILRQSLIEKGKNRAKLYSWERVAQETLKAYSYLA
ncbi:glycosyl transferase family 1 [Cyanobacterium aponinum IPPAS B-1201]|nr:glycosyltransferase family 1 protein [Cyanobacterium aponinum]PHV64319.1 glycosyl transferase family 1 [Cyanobacterium aponinum IPPAS B-1201]